MMLWWPLGYDQAIFAMNGATLLHGGLPYRDAWETRGPLAFYLFAGIEAVFGQSAFAIRLWDVLLLGVASLLLWRLMRRLASARAATLLVAFWTLAVVSTTYNDTAQPDLWVAYAVLGAVLLVSRPEGYRRRHVLLAGFLIGLCTALKPFYGAFGVAPAAAILWQQRSRLPRLVRDLFLLTIAFAAPVAALLGALQLSGAFAEFVNVHLWYNVRVYSGIDRVPFSARASGIVTFFRRGHLMAGALPAVIAGAVALWRRDRTLAIAVLVAACVGVASVALQGRFLRYHWTPVYLLCAPLAALGIHDAFAQRAFGARAMAVASAAVIAFHAVPAPLGYLVQWASYLVGRRSADQYYATFGQQSEVDPGDQRVAAAFLRTHTAYDAPVAVWGVDAAVPFLANRPDVGRFPLTRVLLAAPTSEYTRRYRQEYLRDLRADRPPYVIVGLHSSRQHIAPFEPVDVQFPELGHVLTTQYVLDRRIGDLDVYRRRDFQPLVR